MISDDTAVVLITGANTGIGLETVKALLRSEPRYHILLGARDIGKARQAALDVGVEIESKSEVTPIQIDVESDESIDKAYAEVAEKFGRVDGASFDPLGTPAAGLTLRQAFNKTWDVNVTGTHIVTLTFLPLLLASPDPRLIFLTSGASSLTDASTPGHPFARRAPTGLPKTFSSGAYRASKTSLNMLMLQWHNAVVADGVKVWAVAPGFLATGLGGNSEALRKAGAGEPSVGGEVVRGVVEGKRDEDVGRVVREYGESRVMEW